VRGWVITKKAHNDTAGKASALWISFVTFEFYLAIALEQGNGAAVGRKIWSGR
jgi:hypothetical protein